MKSPVDDDLGVLNTFVADVVRPLDRVTISPLLERLPAAERERILALEGAGKGLAGRELVVTEALDVLDVLREATALLRETQRLLQLEFAFLHDMPPKSKKRGAHRGPLNPRHRTWRGFVEDLQQLEACARREHLRLTRTAVCGFGVDSLRTIQRTMAWHGLASIDWPPSTWDPNTPPRADQ